MTGGPHLFARYAYPPNALGYCGPGDSGGLLEQAAATPSGGADGGRLRQDAARGIADRARGFDGAWPYLQLIAGANGISDPLDARVVEAYWIGNRLLDRVTPRSMGDSLDARFRRQAGRAWERMAEVIPAAGRPHHSFHVFAVYPWLGLLRAGRVDEPLRVLDQCRVRWGQVQEVRGDLAVVRSRPLTWDAGALGYGPPRLETVTLARAGVGFVGGLCPGEWVSLHWDWVCDRLDGPQRQALAAYSALSLAVVNGMAYPAPAAVLS